MVKTNKLMISLVIAAVLVYMVGMISPVHAAEFAKTNIDVRCHIDKKIPSGHTFTYELKAGSETTPMPKDSLYGVKTVKMTKSGKVDFGDIVFDHPEVYYYSISETTGEWGDFRPCQEEYTAILIVNSEGQVQTIIQNNQGEKPDKILLENTYGKKGDDDGGGGSGDDSDGEDERSSAQTGDSIKYIVTGFAAGMFAMFMLLTILKRIATTGKVKVREFR